MIDDDAAVALAAVFGVSGLQFVLSWWPTLLGEDKWQLRRKLQHATSGLAIVSLANFRPALATPCLALSSIAFGLIQWLRSFNSDVHSLFNSMFGPLMRPHELRGAAPGAMWMLWASTAVFATCRSDVASLSIIFLSVGDPVASLIGRAYGNIGRLRHGKSLVGTGAMCAVCFGCTMLLGSVFPPSLLYPSAPSSVWVAHTPANAALASLAAGLTELLPLPVDDNVSVPLVTALTLTLLHAQSVKHQL